MPLATGSTSWFGGCQCDPYPSFQPVHSRIENKTSPYGSKTPSTLEDFHSLRTGQSPCSQSAAPHQAVATSHFTSSSNGHPISWESGLAIFEAQWMITQGLGIHLQVLTMAAMAWTSQSANDRLLTLGHFWETPSLGILWILSAAGLLEFPDEAREREREGEGERERERIVPIETTTRAQNLHFRYKNHRSSKPCLQVTCDFSWKTLRSAQSPLSHQTFELPDPPRMLRIPGKPWKGGTWLIHLEISMINQVI